MASKLSSPHRRKGFVLECRSSKLRLGEKMPSTFWDAAFWGQKVYDAVCKGEYDKATVRSDNFDIETLVVWSQSLLYRANL